jgi:hypothetical protein
MIKKTILRDEKIQKRYKKTKAKSEDDKKDDFKR